eukprot:6213602-Pleurochrysis_carterae.AAC.1
MGDVRACVSECVRAHACARAFVRISSAPRCAISLRAVLTARFVARNAPCASLLHATTKVTLWLRVTHACFDFTISSSVRLAQGLPEGSLVLEEEDIGVWQVREGGRE